MPRRKPSPSTAPAAPQVAPHVTHENAVYGLDSARAALGLAKGCLPREIRLGRLRVAKRAGKYFLLGKWLLAWIESGELRRRDPPVPCTCEAASAANGTLGVVN
jgi:hypothetical protein